MAKFVEMDETVTMKDQMEEEVSGPVILINKFNVEPEKIDQFLKGWQEDFNLSMYLHFFCHIAFYST